MADDFDEQALREQSEYVIEQFAAVTERIARTLELRARKGRRLSRSTREVAEELLLAGELLADVLFCARHGIVYDPEHGAGSLEPR